MKRSLATKTRKQFIEDIIHIKVDNMHIKEDNLSIKTYSLQ